VKILRSYLHRRREFEKTVCFLIHMSLYMALICLWPIFRYVALHSHALIETTIALKKSVDFVLHTILIVILSLQQLPQYIFFLSLSAGSYDL